MPSIPFTQYVRPNGRPRNGSIERPDEIVAIARMIIVVHGCSFTAEVLTTGQVSLACEHPEDGDIAIEIVANGPAIPAAVDRMIREAAAYLRRE